MRFSDALSIDRSRKDPWGERHAWAVKFVTPKSHALTKLRPCAEAKTMR